jgi:hypothetical protein
VSKESVSIDPKLPEWARAVRLAKHYKALGQTEIYLNRDEDSKPWSFVTEMETGGMIRHGQSVSVWFRAKHQKSGLQFRWTFDLEPREANGSSTLQIDVSACRDVLRRLPAKPAEQLRQHLKVLALATRKDADEYLAAYRKWTNRAMELESI